MAIKLEFYSGDKTYMFPSGKIATPEVVLAEYPAISLFPHVVEINGNVLQAILEFESLKNSRGITEENDAVALQMLEDLTNNPVINNIPSPEERIASALEFQNLNSL